MLLFYRLLIGCIQSLAIGVSVGHKYTSKYCEVIAGFFFRIPSLSRIARIIGRSGLARRLHAILLCSLTTSEWESIVQGLLTVVACSSGSLTIRKRTVWRVCTMHMMFMLFLCFRLYLPIFVDWFNGNRLLCTTEDYHSPFHQDFLMFLY